ncbi:MAG: 16S rRNA (cytosine(1402)-N(4))-methyltransferase RsmH [Acidobacteriota bacterium]|nr:MAG: 16S rRNA (cytosine(1402)-N(4))-methyltransferase RsmH [Acidobacteriota bacterium]
MGKLAIGDWFVPEDGFDVDRDVSTHKPVLLGEVVRFLNPSADGVYVDATLGGGGYTEAIVRASAPSGRVLALDRDPEAIRRTGKRLASCGERLRTVLGSFADLRAHIEENGHEAVNGIVADLGLSSDQLGNPDRGFAFSLDGPLDMRFDPTQGPTASDLVNELGEAQLADLIFEYGDERRSRAIARRIVSRRPIETTKELRRAIVSVLGPRRKGIDPATRTFQALRIAVNQELAALDVFLEQAPRCLRPGGRLIVVSYHSHEDRAVKLSFRERASDPEFHVLTKKPVVADARAVADNRRARSAKLRAIERVS